MTRIIPIASLVAAIALTSFGCRKDGADSRAKQDRRPTPVGRLEVDQSAVLPVDVKAGVMREYPGAAVTSVSKRTLDDRAVRYEVQLKTKDGKDVTRIFDADGKPATDPGAAAK